MTLPISANILRNALGYLDLELSMISRHLMTVEDPNRTPEEKTLSENTIKQCSKNIGKLIKTLEERTAWTMPTTGYTTQELRNRRIL